MKELAAARTLSDTRVAAARASDTNEALASCMCAAEDHGRTGASLVMSHALQRIIQEVPYFTSSVQYSWKESCAVRIQFVPAKVVTPDMMVVTALVRPSVMRVHTCPCIHTDTPVTNEYKDKGATIHA